jgi:hypothetical protein
MASARVTSPSRSNSFTRAVAALDSASSVAVGREEAGQQLAAVPCQRILGATVAKRRPHVAEIRSQERRIERDLFVSA